MRNSAYGISKIKCQNMETVKDNKIKASHLYGKKQHIFTCYFTSSERSKRGKLPKSYLNLHTLLKNQSHGRISVYKKPKIFEYERRSEEIDISE